MERHSRIVSGILEFSELFQAFAANGRPIFTLQPDIPTACICFDKDGLPLAFVWNELFFDECDDYKAQFILCHEMLHIFLKHGIRGSGLENHDKANICMDISINHMLIDEFGFNRSLIKGWEKLCWRDTVFSIDVPKLPSFENYYALGDSLFNEGFGPLDKHDFPTEKEKETPKEFEKFFEDWKMGGGGDGTTGNRASELEEKKSKKSKFETLVKKVVASAYEVTKKYGHSWVTPNRRLSQVSQDLPEYGLFKVERGKARFKCAFFMDTSGSCWGMAQRFCNVGAGLNPEIFEVDAYCFDTQAVKMDKDGSVFRIYGGGGTNFQCIDKVVQETKPDIVFVLTDGWASKFFTKTPKLYNWFLVEGGSEASIKSSGKVYRLSQYE